MADGEALKEIGRQEKRFAAANEKAAAMAAETNRAEVEARQMPKKVSRRRSMVAKLRKAIRNGELIKMGVPAKSKRTFPSREGRGGSASLSTTASPYSG